MKCSNCNLSTDPARVKVRGDRRRRVRRGSSFLELVLVVTVTAVLISLSVPSFHRALEQSRADLAGANLRAIWSAERLYWLEYRTYTTDMTALQSLGLLDPNILNSGAFYNYQIVSADANNFVAVATRVFNVRWNGAFSIDSTGVLSGVLTASGDPNIAPGFQ
jgi:Tfp pilus assembly protein PilE